MKIKLLDTIETIGLHRFTLMFKDSELEERFIMDHVYESKQLFRFSILVALFTFSIFATVDFIYAAPDLWVETLTGFISILSLTIATLLFTKSRDLIIYARPTISLAIFFVGLSSVYFICVDDGEFHFKNYLGLYLVFTYAFSFLKLGFFFSFLPTLVIYLVYIVSTLTILDYSFDEYVVYYSFLSFAFLLISVAGYLNEAHLRNEYFLKNQLDIEREKINEQNLKLEVEVEKRTSELLKINKALNRAKLKAQGSESLKSAFIANISHEIRTPLTKLIGFSELLVNDNVPQDKRAKYSQNIQDGSNQLMQLINDLIELSQIESDDISMQKTEFTLHSLLHEIEEITKTEILKAQKEGVVSFMLDSKIDDQLKLTTDKSKLRQVLYNFINNAVKFTSVGTITFHCTERSDSKIEFCIEDTGIGIQEEDFEFIFDSFKQVEADSTRHYGGSGLGLALNKGLVNAMGGKIWLKSSVGKGSRFYFTIPLYVE